MHTRIRVVGTLTLALLGVAAPARAELELPSRVIVVRDFARKRQDLLDTLKVNVPDAKVTIEQFRGPEVVLTVEVPAQKVDDQTAAEEALRRHCDKVVRRAYPGMSLSEDSKILFQRQPVRTAARDAKAPKSLLRRLRGALYQHGNESPASAEAPATADAAVAQAAAEVAQGTAPSEPEKAHSAPGIPDDPERAGYLESLRAATEKRYQKLIARANEPCAPPPLAALSPETTERMARFPAVPVAAAEDRARHALAARDSRKAMLARIQTRPELSAQTREAIRDFQPEPSSYDTIRGIYAQIFEARTPPAPSGPLDPRLAAEDAPKLAMAAVDPAEAEEPQAATAPAPRSSDGVLGDKIAALFDSVKRAEEASN